MASTLARDDVLRIAELAHLSLTEREIELFVRQLADILRYAEQVQQADTTGVPPTSHVFAPATVWRDDEAGASLAISEALANAPSASAGFFKVPKVL